MEPDSANGHPAKTPQRRRLQQHDLRCGRTRRRHRAQQRRTLQPANQHLATRGRHDVTQERGKCKQTSSNHDNTRGVNSDKLPRRTQTLPKVQWEMQYYSAKTLTIWP